MNPKINEFFEELSKWKEELQVLRTYVLDCLLHEELKWKVPCYTHKGKNIVLIHGFKDYYALLFMKGALLQDCENILIQQTENVQSGRQIRFTNIDQLVAIEATLKAYIFEAIELEKSGMKVEFKKTKDFTIPEDFQTVLNENETVKEAFEALTPGRQKGYLLHFSSPKQALTRVSRIEKSFDRILKGKGLNDCTCGLSKRMPNCDGSHKIGIIKS